MSFAEVVVGYYDAVKCQKEGLICINMPLLPKAFQSSPLLDAKSVTQWGIIPLPQVYWGNTSHLHWAWLAGFKLGYHEQGVNRPLR